MSTNVLMPQLGESIAEGTIVRWNKNVGDRVDRDEPLFEVSTDKVDAEVPAPAGGVVAEVLAQVGDTVAVDSVVAIIESTTAPSESAATETADGVGAQPAALEAVMPAPTGRATGVEGPRRGLSPVVRRLVHEHGVDPAQVTGTGAGGRITKADVLAFVRSTTAAAPAGAPAAEGDRLEPLSLMRQRIAEHMVRSRRTSAHVHTIFDVDFTTVESIRQRARGGEPTEKPTVLAFVVRAVVDALVEVPLVNASLASDGTEVVHHADINVGIAVALDKDEGLIVPVIKNAAGLAVRELGRRIADLAARARAKTLAPDEVRQGTFTITNPGVFGSIAGLPIINQPQAAILCVGAVERRAVVLADGTIAARWRSYLTLGFDHRLIDGAIADRFMSVVKARIERFEEPE